MPSTVSEPRTEVRTGPPPPRAAPRTRAERHERPLLLCIAALAALLFLRGLDHSAYHAFYASAVRSMTDSPAAFLYGSFDPAGSITLDKLPGFLWPQALSALAFGFHPWALVLPQAVEGVACVLLLHLVVRRWAGVPAGLAAAGFLTLTPVTVGVGRSVVEDAPFVLLLLLAAEATQRATARARPRTLLLAGFWVGAAFQCKMLEAWAVLPALAVTYLVAVPAPWRRRVGHLALAGAVTAAVSLSWMLVATLTPAGSRPYLDGTTDNSAFGMVVGYNFLTRFHALGVDAAGTGSIVTGRPAHPGGAHVSMGDSVWKMFSPGLATQTGWLYPLAALGLVGGLAALWRRRVPRTDRLLAGHVLWGVWLATFFVVFSFGSVTGHTYYMGVVAVALSALAGAGVVQGWRAVRAGGRAAWLLPAMIAVNVAWCAALTLCYPRFFGWSAPAAGVLCLAGLALTGVRRERAVTAGTAVALAAVLLIPAVWSASALSPRYNQPGGFGRVGPNSIRTGDALSALTPARHRLLAYLTAHRDGARYLAAVPSWTVAAPYVIAADAPVLPAGGFTGRVRFPTPRGLSRLVDSGRLRFVLLRRSDLMDRPGAGRAQTGALARWTVVHCAPVPPAAYGGDGGRYLLYRCGPRPGA
ncbi:glycosyltransferase family 39 protein [Streptomyces shenzhenensis]|uniref:ArnT family glycosyltransferase n=1 Tax=Streptomyces shenzhenensis TaxID=943815 RepID=UPI003D90EDAE